MPNLSPLATLLVLGPRSLALIAVGRALAGLCSGVVFGAATAWVQEVSPEEGPSNGLSARRSALALTAGFGLGPVVAAVLAQWAADPLVVPYLPHLVIGADRPAGRKVTQLSGGLAGIAIPCHGKVTPRLVRDN
jgi:MFS family permease